jgi:recombinational DNA repair ATPase RecF
VLALKAAEADYLLADQSERQLLFLLDDVYSELDEGRRGQVASLIGHHQTVITTTDLSHLDEQIKKSAKIIKLT